MAIRLDIRSGRFRRKVSRLSRHQARGIGRCRGNRARHRRRCRRTRRSGAKGLHAQIRPARSRLCRDESDRGRDRGGARELRPRRARRAGPGARPNRGLSPPPIAARRSLHRRARRRTRLALDRDRSRRALRAGRHRGLPVLGADERGAGQGRRRAAHRHGGAGAGRRTQSAGAGGSGAWPASTRFSASAARRPSRRSPTAPKPSRRSPRSSAPATPMSPPPSASCSARSAST